MLSSSTSSRPAYLPARASAAHHAPAGGVELEVEEMFETLTVAQIREVREGRRERGAAQRRRLFFFNRGEQ